MISCPGNWTSSISSFLNNTLLPIHSQCLPGLSGFRLVLKFLCPTWRSWAWIISVLQRLGSTVSTALLHGALSAGTLLPFCLPYVDDVRSTWCDISLSLSFLATTSHIFTVKQVPKLNGTLSDGLRKEICLPLTPESWNERRVSSRPS